MPVVSSTDLLDALRQGRILEPVQASEVADLLLDRFPEPRALGGELIRRGWLTAYQVNHLFHGSGHELLLGSYVLLEPLGEGGMGQVFKARNWKLGRTVALKLIRKERLLHLDAVRRFRREVEAAAQLSHPNVVHAYDADEVAGTHILVMEYVEGMDLAKLVKEHGPLPAGQACEYVRQAALGLQHAYERGLVHRDIKPHNLLLTHDGSTVKVLDMGLARLRRRAGDEEASSLLTQEGAVMGTVDFIAPEQAMDSSAVDIRADLYSLGCTLYYLLTGRVPFPGGEALAKLAKHRWEEPRAVESLRPDVAPAVGAVVRTLMAKRPEDRYQTPALAAAALADAVGRSLRPTRAGAPADPADPWQFDATVAATEQRLARLGPSAPNKNRRWFLVAGGITLLVGGAVVLLLTLNAGSRPGVPPSRPDAVSPPPLTRLEAAESDLKSLAARTANGTADPARLRDELLAFRLRYYGTPQSRPAAELLALLPSPLDELDPARLPAEVRLAQQPQALVAVLGRPQRQAGARLNCVAFSPDGRRVAAAGEEKVVHIWDAVTGKEEALLRGHTQRIWTLAFAPDGGRLASAGDDGMILLWDLATAGKPVHLNLTGHTYHVYGVAFAPDGQTIASGNGDGSVRLWNVTTGTLRATLPTLLEVAGPVAFAPDGKTLAAGGWRREGARQAGLVELWDVASGRRRTVLRGHTAWLVCVAFTPDGSRLVTTSGDRTVRTWDVGTGKVRGSLQGAGRTVQVVALSPAGRRLVSAGEDGRVILWDLASGSLLKEWQLSAAVFGIALAPDGRHVATANANSTVSILRLAPPPRGPVAAPRTAP